MSSRHLAMKWWEGPAFFPSPPAISAAALLEEELRDGAQCRCLRFSSLADGAWGPSRRGPSAEQPLSSRPNPVPPSHPPSCMEDEWASLSSTYSEFRNRPLRVPARCYYIKYRAFLFSPPCYGAHRQPSGPLRLSAAVRDHHLVNSCVPPLHLRRILWGVSADWGAIQSSHSLQRSCFVLLCVIVMNCKENKCSPLCSSSPVCSSILGELGTARAYVCWDFFMRRSVFIFLEMGSKLYFHHNYFFFFITSVILQPGLVEDVPVHGRGVGTRWSLRSVPTQTILWFFCVYLSFMCSNTDGQNLWVFLQQRLQMPRVNECCTFLCVCAVLLWLPTWNPRGMSVQAVSSPSGWFGGPCCLVHFCTLGCCFCCEPFGSFWDGLSVQGWGYLSTGTLPGVQSAGDQARSSLLCPVQSLLCWKDLHLQTQATQHTPLD